jgi:hypothetical protein
VQSSVADPDPLQIGRLEPDPDPHQHDKLGPDPHPDQFADDKPKCMSLFEHFFKVLSLYLKARIRIRNCIKVKSRIRIRIKVTSRIRIRIRIKATSRIRIRNADP